MSTTVVQPSTSSTFAGSRRQGARIDLAFGFDEAYCPHAAATLASICAHHPASGLRVLLFNDCRDRELRSQFESVAPGAEFVWIDVRDEDVPAFEAKGHINRATLFRLGLEKFAPADCNKVIYFDSDMIVLADIAPLWTMDLQGRSAAAVIDAFIEGETFGRDWNLQGPGEYFNAGILVIDLEKVRTQGLFTAALDIMAKRGRELPFNDQDALNIVLWNDWIALDLPWNVQRHMVIGSLIETLPASLRLGARRPCLIHFTGPEKPWLSKGYHPFAWLYWRALARTPFLRPVMRKERITWVHLLRLLARHVVSSRRQPTRADVA